MTESDRQIKQASKAAGVSGGLTALLLEIRHGHADHVIWDSKKARFIVDGKVISIVQMRAEVARLELSTTARILLYTENLISGRWTVEKWREEMEKLLEDSHTIFAALALGGLAVATSNVDVTRRIDRDVKYVKGFAKVLKVKKPLSHGLTRARARSYTRSIYVTFQLMSHKAHILAGYKEARRVLTPAEHCRNKIINGHVKEGCLEVARRGWMPIHKVPPIGTLVCQQWCKCFVIYR